MMYERTAGTSLMIGGLLGVSAVLIHPLTLTHERTVPAHVLLLLGALLIMLGLPALLARQAKGSNAVGAAGLVMVFLGLAFVCVLHSVLDISALPALMQNETTRHLVSEHGSFGQAIAQTPYMRLTMLGGGLLLLGLPLFGWSLWRTLPARLLAVPLFVIPVLIVGGFAFLPLLTLGQGALYATLGALGVTLFARPQEIVRAPQAMRPT